ncbi:MAG: Stf0 family sulfotransferase [Pseudomonadota bacterium]
MPSDDARPTGLWGRQFEPTYDFTPTPVTTRIAFCTTPRCGSHMLGHRLHATGGFGYPLEYLNPGNLRMWMRRAQEGGAADTLDFIKSVRTGPNGVFAIKLHFEHLPAFLREEPDPLSYHYIPLVRRDLVAQAVSFARAQQTGAWISDMPERQPAIYDFDLIHAKARAIGEGNAGWDAYFAGIGASPLRLIYEDVVQDPEAAVAAICAATGVDLADGTPPETFTPTRQTKLSASGDWKTRYKEDYRQRVVDGRLQVAPLAASPGLRPRFVSWARNKVSEIRR